MRQFTSVVLITYIIGWKTKASKSVGVHFLKPLTKKETYNIIKTIISILLFLPQKI